MGFYPSEGDVDANGAEEVNLRTSAGAELLGQQTSAASLPVVIASNQSAVPISAASLPLPSGAATENTLINVLTTTAFQARVNTLGQKTMADSTPIVIASDQTTVPISIGLPNFSDKLFGYAVGINQPASGTDNPLILLKNPSGSGKTIYLCFVSYGIAVANVFGTIRLYKDPTITSNGTSRTIVAFGSAATSMTLYTTPTISANGTLLTTEVSGQNNNSILLNIDYSITIAANSSLLITGDPGSNNRQAEISLRWIEL